MSDFKKILMEANREIEAKIKEVSDNVKEITDAYQLSETEIETSNNFANKLIAIINKEEKPVKIIFTDLFITKELLRLSAEYDAGV
jgi:rRNA maturation endonuclease Nob1